jgi:mannose-1-phosphate guanylyltransferase
MKAMLLAAGLGMRMRPLSLLAPKPAMPVLNRPLIHFILDWLARQGVRSVVVNLHYLPQAVERAVRSWHGRGLKFQFSYEDQVLGTGGGPRKVRDFFGNEPFLLVNGDAVCDFDLAALVGRHQKGKACATLALRPNQIGRAHV